ncbi:hypothetical protein XPA_004328 [Xanthoria parietina]
MSVIDIRPRGEHEKVSSNCDSPLPKPGLSFRTIIVPIITPYVGAVQAGVRATRRTTRQEFEIIVFHQWDDGLAIIPSPYVYNLVVRRGWLRRRMARRKDW